MTCAKSPPDDAHITGDSNAAECTTSKPPPTNSMSQRLMAAIECKIEKATQIISTSAGQDAVLSSTEYLAYALHHSFGYFETRGLVRNELNEHSRSQKQSPVLALSTLISDTRYTLRLLGVIRILNSGFTTKNQKNNDSRTKIVSNMEIILLLMYQASENVLYLVRKGIFCNSYFESPSRIKAWSLWSARFLLGYFILQIAKLLDVMKRSIIDIFHAFKRSTGEDNVRSTPFPDRLWWKSLIRNGIWTSLCLHWSLERGLGIPDSVCGIAAFLAEAWRLYDILREEKAISPREGKC